MLNCHDVWRLCKFIFLNLNFFLWSASWNNYTYNSRWTFRWGKLVFGLYTIPFLFNTIWWLPRRSVHGQLRFRNYNNIITTLLWYIVTYMFMIIINIINAVIMLLLLLLLCCVPITYPPKHAVEHERAHSPSFG